MQNNMQIEIQPQATRESEFIPRNGWPPAAKKTFK